MRVTRPLYRAIAIGGLFIVYGALTVWGQSGNQLDFNLAPRHETGLNTTQTIVADLDLDGRLDIASVNGGQQNPNPSLTIRYGNSSAGFESQIVRPTFTIGETLAAGDLNGDSLPEIVVASWYQNVVAVFVNLGDRQFSSPVFSYPPNPNSPAVGEYYDLAIEDFDGDGNNDVVGLEDRQGQRLRFFHFNADASLTVFATLDQIGQASSSEGEMAVGDINSDGRADVVLAGGGPFGPRSISFVFGQQFGQSLTMTFGFSVFDESNDIALADFDHDSDLDIAVISQFTNNSFDHAARIYRNNGNLSFTGLSPQLFSNPFIPVSIVASDLDNDGNPDLAILMDSPYDHGVMVRAVFGNGNGTFADERYFAVAFSSSIAAADFNRDGRNDLITASSFLLQTDYSQYTDVSNNAVSIILNRPARNFDAPPVVLWGPHFIESGDFNNDGLADLVSSWSTGLGSTSGVDILINDAHGGFAPEIHNPSPQALVEMKTADINGDGNADAITIHEDDTRVLAGYVGNGTGSVGAPITTPFTNGLLKSTIGDFNSDGKDDVLVIDDVNRGFVMLSNGNGSFAAAPGSPITFQAYVEFDPEVGDFNEDGHLDLIMGFNSNVKLWLGDGTGQFTQSGTAIPSLKRITTGDYNGDGHLDLAGMTGPGGTTSNYLTGLLGDGQGGFSSGQSQLIRNFGHNATSDLRTADFDLDGFDDVLIGMVTNTFGNVIIVRSGGPALSWQSPIFLGVGTATGEYVVADFNNDSKPDIGYRGGNSRGVILNTTPRTAVPFDFDGDGFSDISVFRPTNGQWWIDRTSSGLLVHTFGNQDDRKVPADFTGDGKTDIAIFRPGVGTWYVLRSDNFSFFAFPFGLNGDIPTPGDFDGDGKADAAVFRPSNSTWYVQRSSGGTAIKEFGSAGDIPVASDYDGDNKTDFAVFRPISGQWWIDRSNDGVIAATFGVATDKPVQGDYTGDGRSDIAIWRQSNGNWYILRSEDATFFAFPFGLVGDIPTPGDYDGDGKIDAAVFRPSTATWYVYRSMAGILIREFGAPGDQPVPGTYVPQ